MHRRWMRIVHPLALATVLWLAPVCTTQAQEYSLSWIGDGALLATGLSSAILSQVLLQSASPGSLGSIDIAKINAFDRLAVFGYSNALDVTSDVLQYTTAAIPVMFAFLCRLDQAAAIGVVYLEALSWAFAAKNLLKFLVPRYRPYVYSPLPAGGGPPPSEYADSFPSGHATIAFTAAAFSLYTFQTYFPSSPYLLPLALAGYGLAGLTATFRVVSGMHFLTDVLAGALLGTAMGYGIPLLHRAWAKKGGKGEVELEASPAAVMLRVSW
jgi:membrane-associated phospholipid phosphatase